MFDRSTLLNNINSNIIKLQKDGHMSLNVKKLTETEGFIHLVSSMRKKLYKTNKGE